MQRQPSANFRTLQLAATHIASHPRLYGVVEELEGNPERIAAANADSSAFLQSRGIELLGECNVRFAQGNSITIRVCVDGECIELDLSDVLPI